jgi:dihydroorotase
MIGFINAKVYQNGIFQPLNIYTKDEVIVEVTPESRDCAQLYDLSGMMILLGLVDKNVHFLEGGQSYKETFYSGSRATRKGGITYVGDTPNNNPPITTPEGLRRKRGIARRDPVVNFGLYAAVTPESLHHLVELTPCVLAFKLFMGESTGKINYPYDRLEEAFEAVGKLAVYYVYMLNISEY